MKSDWKTVTLSSIISFSNGKKRPKKSGCIPVYGGNGVLDYADSNNYENCIIIGRVGVYCGSVYYENGKCWVSDNAIAALPLDCTDVHFAYYLLKSLHLNERHIGTSQPLLTQGILNNIECNIPELSEQKQIASILYEIDSKITMNTAINENLEQQAQALFKAWFVDFEPFGGVMPDDWRIGTLSEICGYSKDKVDIDDLTLDTYYSTENMQPNRQGAVQATTLPTIKQTTACKKGDVLISNIRPYFKKILYCFSDCGCSTDVLCFVPNKTDYSAFLYCALYADKFFDYMVAGSKGTKMPRGDKQQIMVYPICIPSAEYIKKFNQAVAPMLETVYTNRIEANNLANLRDTLLPKLMNGEIDVSAVKI